MADVSETIQITPRDTALLRGLFESRVMTLAHMTALYFDGKPEAAKKRVQKLKASRFIREKPRRAYDPSLLFLTAQGYRLLVDAGHVDMYPSLTSREFEKRAQVSDRTIEHELDVMDVKCALSLATDRAAQIAIAEFTTWPRLYEFSVARSAIDPRKGGDLSVKPDAFIRIHEEEANGRRFEHAFFLEVDRSNESQGILSNKGLCYAEYYSSGGFAARNGQPRSAFKDFPFRVLMVLPNTERRNNTAERLLLGNARLPRLTWLTTLPEILSDPLGPVWITPKEYQAAVDDTRFRVDGLRESSVYRRQPERQEYVEQAIARRSLFE